MKNFNTIANSIGKAVQKTVHELIDEYAPRLHLVLDYLKPQARALGLRVARLSPEKIEVVLPDRPRNRGEHAHLHEGAVTMAACEVARWLWLENKPDGVFELEFSKVQLEKIDVLIGDLRLRAELDDVAREKALYQFREMKRSEASMQVLVYNREEKLVAKVELEMQMSVTPTLEWKS